MRLFGYGSLRPKAQRTFQDLLQNILKGGSCNSCCHYSESLSENENSSADISPLKHASQHSKALEKKKLLGISTAILKTIGSGAVGAPSCLLALISKNRYVFNCGEAADRVSMRFVKNLLNCSALFITNNSLRNIVGLNSLLLTRKGISKQSKQDFFIYGPSGLSHLLDVISNQLKWRPTYIPVKNEKINFEQNISIQPVPIFSSEIERGSTNYAVAYICKLAPREGELSIDSVAEAGIPPGPWFQQLLAGQSITLPNGLKFSPDQFERKHCFKATTFIVIEVPSSCHLDSLVSCSDFQPHQAGSGKLDEDMPEVIVHFTPPQVMKDSRYRQWINAFSPSVSHLILNENNECLGLKAPVLQQLQLNYLLPNVFPLLHDASIPFSSETADHPRTDDILNPQMLTDEYGFTGPTVQSNTHLTYFLRPNTQFKSQLGELTPPQKLLHLTYHESDDIKTAITRMNKKFEELRSQLPKKSRPYPRVLFLGTTSPPSSSRRGNSAILVHTDPDSCFLLDCGDGTFSQMIRLMGREKTEATLRQLKLVYVSHHHFDHHGGLANILGQRRKAFSNAGKKLSRLFLLLPDDDVMSYLKEILKMCREPIMEEEIILENMHVMKIHRNPHLHSLVSEMYDSVGMGNIDLCFVPHCKRSCGIALSHSSGWKLTYSGDTTPSNKLIKIGMNSDILIHEATFEDDLADLASRKSHCTVSQAIAAGREMNAHFTLLTHFSSRYEVPVLKQCPKDVGIAFDNMMVTLDDLPYLPHLYPVFKELFFESLELHKNKIFRRKYLLY